MSSKPTTIRAPQDAKVERELHKIIGRNATDAACTGQSGGTRHYLQGRPPTG